MRKSKLTKTSKQSIYETYGIDGSKQYIVRFSYLGKSYGERNFTKLFGCRTLKQTYDKFQEVKVELSKGKNPFEKKTSHTIDDYFNEYKKTLKDENQKITIYYYNKHIKPVIGSKKVMNISEKNILNILNGTLKDLSDRSKQTLKVILNPIFKKAMKQKKLIDNPLEEIKFTKPKPKNELSYRIVTDPKETVQILYKEIQKIENIELRAVYLIGLMTGRRRGEILGLKYKNIKGSKVFVPESITKTSVVDEFPLPDEVVKLIKTFPKRENIFTVKEDRVSRGFTKLVNQSEIDITEGSKLTFHDTRNLFQSIMIPETLNSDIVDRCLSHMQDGSMKSVYLSIPYEKRKEVFEKYWDIVRG